MPNLYELGCFNFVRTQANSFEVLLSQQGSGQCGAVLCPWIFPGAASSCIRPLNPRWGTPPCPFVLCMAETGTTSPTRPRGGATATWFLCQAVAQNSCRQGLSWVGVWGRGPLEPLLLSGRCNLKLNLCMAHTTGTEKLLVMAKLPRLVASTSLCVR